MDDVFQNGRLNGQREVLKAIEAITLHYSQADTIRSITSHADLVARWLSDNKHSTDKRGDVISGSPWFPIGAVDFTEDPDRLDNRKAILRNRLWGHGMRRLLNHVIDGSLLREEAYDYISRATDYRSMSLHDELIGFRLGPDPSRSVSLKDVRDRFDFSELTNPTKLRDGRLMWMATFGLWKVSVDGIRYDIRLGQLAEIFHFQVFAPLRKKFEPLLTGGAK